MVLQVGTTNPHGSVNQSTDSYIALNWKVNGGTTSTNDEGDITTTVQVNQKAGFSIVTYTGTGTQSDTVGHGLGVKPKMGMVKIRSEALIGTFIEIIRLVGL